MATANKSIKTRVQLKSDTEANWNRSVLEADGGTKASGTSFVPLLGEMIVYTADASHPFSRLKVGNGITNVVKLPFIDAGTIGGETIPVPESEVYIFQRKNLFPEEGEANKLYVDEYTQSIYFYSPITETYSQLSNFTYTINKTSMSSISEWDRGTAATMSVSRGVLSLTTGKAPKLTYLNSEVVSNVTKEAIP